jgi:hypothetical protein
MVRRWAMEYYTTTERFWVITKWSDEDYTASLLMRLALAARRESSYWWRVGRMLAERPEHDRGRVTHPPPFSARHRPQVFGPHRVSWRWNDP